MPVPSTINDLSTAAGSNYPAGGDPPTTGDDVLRALSSFIAQLRDQLNGTSNTGTVKNAALSGTMTGAAAFAALQSFSVGLNTGNSAQASATTLDWYEEGTFTPVVQGFTTAGTGTYTNQIGRFTRIGNRVFVNIDVRWTAHTGTGEPVVTGLPYTPANSFERLLGSYFQGTLDRPAIVYMSTASAKTGGVQTYITAFDAFANVAIVSTDSTLNLSGSYSV